MRFGLFSHGLMFCRVPLVKLSKTQTLAPWVMKASTRWLPMKPDPPVTSTFSVLLAFISVDQPIHAFAQLIICFSTRLFSLFKVAYCFRLGPMVSSLSLLTGLFGLQILLGMLSMSETGALTCIRFTFLLFLMFYVFPSVDSMYVHQSFSFVMKVFGIVFASY